MTMKILSKTFVFVNFTEPSVMDEELNQYFEEILEKAKQTNTILEINASMERLDLKDVNVRAAVKAKIKLSIGTDSHDANQLKNYSLGNATARRGWAEKKDIINTNSVKEMLKLLKH